MIIAACGDDDQPPGCIGEDCCDPTTTLFCDSLTGLGPFLGETFQNVPGFRNTSKIDILAFNDNGVNGRIYSNSADLFFDDIRGVEVSDCCTIILKKDQYLQIIKSLI